jgi:predicted kinase
MLIALAGLPGTGKTTLARTVAARYAAVYLRIDTIEQAIRSSDVLRKDIGAAGYITAYRIAADNLWVGRSVVGDAVNPLKVTRDSWAEIARLAGVPLIEVEVLCSDLEEHRARVGNRFRSARISFSISADVAYGELCGVRVRSSRPSGPTSS